MILYPADYTKEEDVAVEVPKKDRDAIIAKIKELVVVPTLDEDVVKMIQKEFDPLNKHYTNNFIIECVKEVDLEWHPVEEIIK